MIDFERLERELDSLTKEYRSASPFEHLVLDDFLTADALDSLHGTIPDPVNNDKSSDFLFAKNKFENPRIEEISAQLENYRDELLSERFRMILCEITGLNLFLDHNFVGGGLHQGGTGSYLDMHCDFTRHPEKNNWVRELNLLLYLNREYESMWGGCLDLKNKHTGDSCSIKPVDNRMVVMLTKPHTLHGYRPIKFPQGNYRTSIAAYAYSIDDGKIDVPYKSTQWFPESRGRRFWARLTSPLVVAKQKIFGSRTAKRAKRD